MDSLRKHFVEGAVLNDRYETLSPLNHGSFGMVFMATDRTTGALVALKCLAKSSATDRAIAQINVDERSEELKIHSLLGSHPHIVDLLNSFETDTHTYLVLEYCSMGDLYEAIRQDKGPKETEHVRDFMLQLVDAVDFLHSKGISHRDIKPENIFLTGTGNMKLGDFGLATTDAWSYEAAVGSDRYMAPEQYDPAGNGLAPAKADIWSVGICLLNILFSRNPFGIPAVTDPLFCDFIRDRQSLFDVFPNMSQDTFEVLIHCLAIDPQKRCLASVKEALERVVSFTTDDETLDEFCTEHREVVTATANREPLRTPSITSAMNDHTESFPWSKALHMTTSPHAHNRQLSVIHDANESVSEDLFPASEASHDWFSKADTQSLSSVVDSGLGVSLGSSETSPVARSKPVAIAGALPILGQRAGRAISSIFGKKQAAESKSWSDMWDEEEAEHAQEALDQGGNSSPLKVLSQSQADSEEDGRSTPRACLRELKNPNGLNQTQESLGSTDKDVSEHTGFVFEDPNPVGTLSRLSPVKRSLIDKWAALGERRRALHAEKADTKNGSEMQRTDKESPTPDATKKNRLRTSTWRCNIPAMGNNRQAGNGHASHGVWQRQEWSKSTDWRRSDQHLSKSSPLAKSQMDGMRGMRDFENEIDNAFGEWQWVGGLQDFHL